MDKASLSKLLNSQKAKDYTYAIAFLIISSFFSIFLIRPNLVEIFTSSEKMTQMRKVDSFYEEEISKSLQLQKSIELIAGSTQVLDESIPSAPKVNKIFSDIRAISDSNNLTIKRMDIADINLKDSGKGMKAKTVGISLELQGEYTSFSAFLTQVYNQRRLKLVKSLDILKESDNESTASGSLIMRMQVEGYYL